MSEKSPSRSLETRLAQAIAAAGEPIHVMAHLYFTRSIDQPDTVEMLGVDVESTTVCEIADSFVQHHDIQMEGLSDEERREKEQTIRYGFAEEAAQYFPNRTTADLDPTAGGHEDWEYELHPDGELDCDPCPECGAEGFVNARLVLGGQYAKQGEGLGDHALDDSWFEELEYARCGNCDTTLME